GLLIFFPVAYGLLLGMIRYFVKDQQVDSIEIILAMVGIAIANFFITVIQPTEEEKVDRKQRTLKEYVQDFIINGSGFHKYVLWIYIYCILLFSAVLVLFL